MEEIEANKNRISYFKSAKLRREKKEKKEQERLRERWILK